MGRTAKYLLNLLEQVLGPAEREKRFEWALGDVSPKTLRAARLPFDAVWEHRKLIIEVDEDQHREATPFFDKPHRKTVSGVHRGEQRPLYAERKRSAAHAHGYKLVVIEWSLKRKQLATDLAELIGILEANGVQAGDDEPSES